MTSSPLTHSEIPGTCGYIVLAVKGMIRLGQVQVQFQNTWTSGTDLFHFWVQTEVTLVPGCVIIQR